MPEFDSNWTQNGCGLHCGLWRGGKPERILNDSKGDEESGQIGDSGIDERYVIKNNVQPFFPWE